MKKLFIGAVALSIMISGMFAFLPVQTRPQPAAAQQQSDKYDGDCTGQETEGRCADKCPDGSYAIDYTETGAAICKQEPTGCPYGDSIPLGPECDKHAQESANQPPAAPVKNSVQCGGN